MLCFIAEDGWSQRAMVQSGACGASWHVEEENGHVDSLGPLTGWPARRVLVDVEPCSVLFVEPGCQ
jgi:hypothetical protein